MSLYNLLGAVAWVALCLGAGWFFGNVPIVKNNFSLVTIGIVFVSILPVLFELSHIAGVTVGAPLAGCSQRPP